jgi:hypothetical protein
MYCVPCVSPVAKRDDKAFSISLLESFFVVFMMMGFFVMIFKMNGPNMTKNRPCQNHPLVQNNAYCIFRLFIYDSDFLSLVSASIAWNPDLSFLKYCQDLMTKKLSNLSLGFKKYLFLHFLSRKFIFFPGLSLLNRINSKRDQGESDKQKWVFF